MRTTRIRAGAALIAMAAILAGAAPGSAAAAAGTPAVAWGFNGSGQLGDGTQTSRSTPVAVGGSAPGFVRVASGPDHSLAVAVDGTVWAWGGNAKGQLGDGTTTPRSAPVQVPGMTGVVRIAAGTRFTTAVRSDGTVWTWGSNEFGELGDGTVGNVQTTPQQVQGVSGVVDVASGYLHSLALRSDGTVWTWGDHHHDDGTPPPLTPMQVQGLAGVSDIAIGGYRNVAVQDPGGLVYTWGEDGQPAPQQVQGVSGVVDVADSSTHIVAVRSDGTVWTWGSNVYGELGDGTQMERATPGQVTGLSDITQVAAGYFHSLAVRSDGTVWTWGYNGFGQLGNGTAVDRLTPAQIPGLTQVAQISTGLRQAHGAGSHTLAVRVGFRIELGPQTGGLGSGQSLTVPVAVVSVNGYSQPVDLSVGIALPKGSPPEIIGPRITMSFAQKQVPAGATTTLTLTNIGPDISPGSAYVVTVTGRGLSPTVTASDSFMLNFAEEPPPDCQGC